MLYGVYGTAGTGKTRWLLKAIEDRMQNKMQSYVLVPEQFSLYTEKKMLQTFGMQGQRYVKVMTFSRLCNFVMQKYGPLRLRYIDGAGRQIVARRVFGKLEKKLRVLGRNTRQKGFAQIMTGMISECKRYGVQPEDLIRAAEQTADRELADKLLDIADMYTQYNLAIAHYSADADDNLSMIADRLADVELLDGHLYLWHFRSFTPTEYQALSNLMRRMDVTAVLCTDTLRGEDGIFAPVVHTWTELCRAATEAGVQHKVLAECKEEIKFKTRPALLHLKQQYFAPRPAAYNGPTDELAIVTPTNYYRETEAAADLILRLCRTEGYRMRDFLVLARETERYKRIMPSVFQSRGLSVFLDTKRPVGNKPLFRMIRGILECLSYGYSYERVTAIARTGFTSATREEVDLLENYLLETAPSHAMWQDERWRYNPDERQYDMEQINIVRQKVTVGVRFMETQISGVKTAEEICGALLAYLKEADFARRMKQRCEAFSAEGRPELAEEERQTWNALLSILAQMGSVLKEEKMTYKQFLDVFLSAGGSVEIGITPQTLDAVCLSDIDRFRDAEAKVVLVLGVNAGVFPKGYSAEGLLSDRERSALLTLGIRLAPTMAIQRAEEQILLYNVLTAASEKLFLFSPLGDNDGRALRPSEVVEKLRYQLFPEISVVDPDADDPTGGAQSAEAVFEILLSRLADCGGKDALPAAFQPVYTYFAETLAYAGRLSTAEEAVARRGESPLSKAMVKKLYGAPIALSASRLEQYHACAFHYFMTYGLFAEERQKAGIEPRSTGSIQHAALYAYFSDLAQRGQDLETVTRAECYQALDQLVEQEVQKDSAQLFENSAYYQYVVMRMRRIAARTAWEVVKFYQNSRFRPYGFEIRIGREGELPAIRVARSDGTELARISGLIDRADTVTVGGKTFVNVVDYKSSAKKLSVRLAEDGICIQPLLYTSALCDQIAGGTPGAMLYMQMTEPMVDGDKIKDETTFEREMHKGVSMSGWMIEAPEMAEAYGQSKARGAENFVPQGEDAISLEEMQRRIAAANEKILEAAEGITGGNIAPIPYVTEEHDACAYCPYDAVCRASGVEIPHKKI